MSQKFGLVLKAVLFAVLVAGCASNKTDDVKTGQPEPVEEVMVAELILGAGDTIDISVYRNDDLKKTIKIDSSGKIMFPLIGDVTASGKSVFALRDEMQTRLARYIVNPQVSINATILLSQKIMVLGEVYSPGIFTLDTELRAIEAVTKAGGMTDDAKLTNVILVRRDSRGKPVVSALNLSAALTGDTTDNKLLQNGDILYLPSVAIADVSWYFNHISKILSPIVNLESGLVLWPQARDVLRGSDTSTTPLSIPAR